MVSSQFRETDPQSTMAGLQRVLFARPGKLHLLFLGWHLQSLTSCGEPAWGNCAPSSKSGLSRAGQALRSQAGEDLLPFTCLATTELENACGALLGKPHPPLLQLASPEQAIACGTRLGKLCFLCHGWPPSGQSCLGN